MSGTGSRIKKRKVNRKDEGTGQGGGDSGPYSSRMHPLLMPSVFVVLLENLHSQDVHRCRLICKTWNDLIRTNSAPVLIPKILSRIIEFIPENYLIKSRLVCSLWNRMIVGSNRWTEVDMEYGGRDKHFFFTSRVGSEDFQRFQTKFGDPNNLPLPLAFTHFSAPNNISFGDPTTENFLSTYGRYIKLLNMYRCKWDLEDLRKTLFENASNIEHFQLTCGIIPGTQIGKGKKMVTPELDVVLHEDPANPPTLLLMRSIEIDMNLLDAKDNPRAYVEQFIEELLTSCANLQELNVNVSSWYARTWLTNFIATNDKLSLRNLKVLAHIIDPDLSQVINLQIKQLPLTTLKIRIRYKDVTLEALHELFVSLKHTLTFLQLIFIEYKCAHEFPSGQELYKLKHLELWKFRGQLDFLKDLVALEELLIGEMELKGQTLFNQRDIFKVLLPNLKKVTFKDYWETHLFS